MLGYSFCKNQKTNTNKNGSRKIADTDNSNTEETDTKEEVAKTENPKLEEFKNPVKAEKPEDVTKTEPGETVVINNKKEEVTKTENSKLDETKQPVVTEKPEVTKVEPGETAVINNKKEEIAKIENSKSDETKQPVVIEKPAESVVKVAEVKDDVLDEKSTTKDSAQTNKNDSSSFANLKGEKNNISEENETNIDLKNKKEVTKEKPNESVVGNNKNEENTKTENTKQNDSEKTETKSITKESDSIVQVAKAKEQKAKENLVKEDILDKINILAEEAVFDLNSSQLNAEALRKLDEIAALIKTDPSIKLNIIGHTCSKGPKEFNDLLSVRRANYVRQQLMKRGVKSTNFKRSIGDGSSNPLFDNSSNDQRKNRSIRFALYK
jgi:outer membrane protein OmpA-like peptidoglycan-associated protein